MLQLKVVIVKSLLGKFFYNIKLIITIYSIELKINQNFLTK